MDRLLLSLGLVAALAGGGRVAADSGAASAPTQIPNRPAAELVEGVGAKAADPSAVTAVQGQQVVDAAMAGALIGALETRFSGQKVEVQLGDMRSERVSLRDLAIKGDAKIRFEDGQSWLPIRFQALYDTSAMTAESPHVTLGESLPESRSASSLPLQALRAQIDAALARDYQSNRVRIRLPQARIVGDDGSRYVVLARGRAEFDGRDRVELLVRGLYDRRSGRWIDAQYDLGGETAPDVARR